MNAYELIAKAIAQGQSAALATVVHVEGSTPRDVGSKMVVYDDVEPLEKIRVYDKGVEVPPYTDTFGDFQCSYRYGDVVIPNIRFVEPLRKECQHFLDCIANDTQPQSCGWVGLKVVKVLEMAERSLQNGGRQEMICLEDQHMHKRVVA